MSNLRFATAAAVLIGIVAAAVAGGAAAPAAAQTPTDSPPGVPRFTKVVQVDACNACVQSRGCDHQNTHCTDGCASSFPPNDPRGAKCLAGCSRLQNRCVREAEKACQACK
jgi:hypothetical protein